MCFIANNARRRKIWIKEKKTEILNPKKYEHFLEEVINNSMIGEERISTRKR